MGITKLKALYVVAGATLMSSPVAMAYDLAIDGAAEETVVLSNIGIAAGIVVAIVLTIWGVKKTLALFGR